MIEAPAIYNVPARATDFTYLGLTSLPVPFRSANENEGCRLGYFVKNRGTITNLHYPSFCRAWSFSPGAELLQTRVSSKLSVYLSRPGSSQGGCYHKGPICYPGFTPSQEALFGTFIYQEKAVNASKKVCTLSLCYRGCWLHLIPMQAEQTWGNYSSEGRLTEPRGRELPWTFKLRPGGIATPDPYVNILCTNCTAVQSPRWIGHFNRRRIFLLAAARRCLRALTPSSDTGTSTQELWRLDNASTPAGWTIFHKPECNAVIYHFHLLLETLWMIDWSIL